MLGKQRGLGRLLIRSRSFSESAELERQFIDWLTANLPTSPCLRLGAGDDAAVLRWAEGGDLVVTTDAVTDQVDFVLADVDPRLVGHKALGVNLSDLAAMAAEPVAVVVSLVLPRQGSGRFSALELAVELYRGLVPLAEKFGVAIAGGDTNTWDGPLVISVTAFGRTTSRGPLSRSGAKPGDAVLVTGRLGGSILGRHLNIEPRVREALLLHERYDLHAGMDISDGLALDASRLAAASGCGIALRQELIPVSDDAVRLAKTSGKSAVDHALGDGEDFELLLTASAAVAEQMLRDQPLVIPVTRVGWCVDQPGLWEQSGDGSLAPMPSTGYQH